MLNQISNVILDASNSISNDINSIIKSDIGMMDKINGIEYHKNRIIKSTQQIKVLAKQLALDIESCDISFKEEGITRPHECPVYKRLLQHMDQLSEEE